MGRKGVLSRKQVGVLLLFTGSVGFLWVIELLLTRLRKWRKI